MELEAEPLAAGDHLGRVGRGRGQVGEQEEHGETVVQIPQRVDEGRVTLPDDVVEGIARLPRLLGASSIPLQLLRVRDIAAAESTRDLLFQRLLVTELGDQRLVEQVLYVFGVVE